MDAHIFETSYGQFNNVYFKCGTKRLSIFLVTIQCLSVAQAHQKWLSIDFIHFLRILQEAFLLAASNLFLMFLAICQTSHWWSMFGSSHLMNFLICVCWSVVICSRVIPWSFKKANPFLNPIFSIWFKFPASVTCVKKNTAVLLVFLSIKEYVKYFALWPKLSHLPSPFR